MLSKVERLEKILFQGGEFSVKNVVTLGRKSATGNRLDPIYSKSFASTKYNDRPTLETVTFNQNEYIVFAYNHFDSNNRSNSVNEEIYISYPHMNDLLEFIGQCYDLVNTPEVFTNNSVAVRYQEVVVESAPMASGKTMVAVPAIWDGKEQNSIKKGILLFLSNENICIQLDIVAVNSLYYIINNFNLSLESNQLLIMGMLNEVASANPVPAYGQGFKNTSNQVTANNNVTQNRRGLFGNSGNRRTTGGLGNRLTNNSRSTNSVESEQETTVETQQESQSTNNTKSSKLSMDNIMNVAKEIEVEDINDVEI